MDYQQTLTYLFSKLPMFSRIGAAAYRNDLTNTIKLSAFIGNPERRLMLVRCPDCDQQVGLDPKGRVLPHSVRITA